MNLIDSSTLIKMAISSRPRVSWDSVRPVQALLRPTSGDFVSVDQLALLTEYVFRLASDLLKDDEPHSSMLEAEVPYWMNFGYSRSTALRLAAARQLTDFSAAVTHVIEHASDAYRRTNLEPSFNYPECRSDLNSILRELVGQRSVPLQMKYNTLHQISVINLLNAHLVLLGSMIYNIRRPMSGVSSAQCLRHAAACISIFCQFPSIIGALSSDLVGSLDYLIGTIDDGYANEIREWVISNDETIDRQRTFVFDPECSIAVALIGLVKSVLDLIRGRGNSADVSDEFGRYTRLLQFNRGVEEIHRIGSQNAVNDFVRPLSSSGQWPASIPEVELILRYAVLEILSNNPHHGLITERGWLCARLDEWTYLVKSPTSSCFPVSHGLFATRLSSEWSRIPLLTWLAFPSALGTGNPGGAFAKSIYSMGAYSLWDAVREQEGIERARKLRRQLTELAAVGGGAALAGPVVSELLPQVPDAVAVGVGAMMSELIVQWANWLGASTKPQK